MPRGNTDNLRTPTSEEARERGQKGGIKSGEARRDKKQLQDALKKALTGTYQIGDQDKGDAQKLGGYDAMAISIIKAAINGDVRAFVAIRDTIGEKPKETVEVDTNELTGIKIKFVNKSHPNNSREKDPKIIGEYTPPSNTDEG